MSENNTTTNTISCPADGCDYSGQSVPAVRAHVNSIGDPDHPMWGEIKDDIDTESESTENQTEPSKNQESDSDTDSDTMPTTDEYEQQYSDDDTDDTDDSDATDALSIPNLPMNPTTLLVLFVVGISLYLMYRSVSSSGVTDIEPDEDTTPSMDTETDDLQPGLVQ